MAGVGGAIGKPHSTIRGKAGCSAMKFTSVASLHINTFGCGVTKFSAELAKRLGVPFVGVCDDWGDFPLLSLKWSEFLDPGDIVSLRLRCCGQQYGLFWHDAGDQSVL